MKIIELSVDLNIVQDWCVEDAVRDLIQNYLDADGDKDYSITGSSIELINYDTSIHVSNLLLGKSSKRDDDQSRGRHGDGLKSSLAVLLRNGKDVVINNGPLMWVPKIVYSETFDAEVLAIEETETDYYLDFKVTISGIDTNELINIQSDTLEFYDEYPEHIETDRGNILTSDDQEGRIYCGGLFVQTCSSLSHGYDFKPDVLKLDRDRKTVRDFDIQWITKDMWGLLENDEDSASLIVEGIENNQQDFQYLESYCISSTVKDKIYENFVEENEDCVVAQDYEEAKTLESKGFQKVAVVSNSKVYNIIKDHSDYQKVNLIAHQEKTVDELLEEFKDQWYDEFSTEMLDSFNELQNSINEIL